MKLPILAASVLFSLAEQTLAQPLDNFGSPSGSNTCAVITILMDESGSMGDEIDFVKNYGAIESATTELSANVNNVFVCGVRYGHSTRVNNLEGYPIKTACAKSTNTAGVADAVDFNVDSDGWFEDAFEAMKFAIDNVDAVIDGHDLLAECSTIAKNLIVFTDEDDDHRSGNNDPAEMLTYADNRDWTVNIVCNCDVQGGAIGVSGQGFLYTETSGGNFIATPGGSCDGTSGDSILSDAGDSEIDYPPAACGTGGAIWDLNKIRAGGNSRDSFAKALVDVKVQEIIEDVFNGGGARAGGDPHLTTFSGERFDFHGICDLVLLTNEAFLNGAGLDIHIRNERMRMWSFIKTAAIRIGEDVFEVMGGKDGKFYFNGVEGKADNLEINEEVANISGYPVVLKTMNEKSCEFVIDLGTNEAITLKTWNSFVTVNIQRPRVEHFRGSLGLLGHFPTGRKVARDGKTILNDLNEFGQEWQVLGSESKLFHTVEGPQYPSRCEIPSSGEMRRRLEESTVTVEEAEIACAHVDVNSKDMCMFDVMATSDESVAGAY